MVPSLTSPNGFCGCESPWRLSPVTLNFRLVFVLRRVWCASCYTIDNGGDDDDDDNDDNEDDTLRLFQCLIR